MAKKLTRRQFMALSAMAGTGLSFSLLGGQRFALAQDPTQTPGALPPPSAPGPISAEAAGGLDKIIEAAKAEGELSTIALPDDWANYKELKASFFGTGDYEGKGLYSFLKLNDLNPDAGSADEIEAIKANAGNSGPQNPDVIDVGFIWGEESKKQGLLQPYKVATWDSIPADQKDPDGYWYANYYGTMAFEYNADAAPAPTDWSDLLKPEYKGLIAMSGDPVTANQPAYVVWAASYALSGGKLDQPQVGLDFFKQLADAGNLIASISQPATIASGETPLTMRWDYNALGNRDANKDTANIAVAYPKSGSLAGVYVCAISAYSPRPNAARLWMEHVYSDAGQNMWLKGYATPIRYADMLERKVVPQETLDMLPKADISVGFPTAAQITESIGYIQANWAKVVGVSFS